MEAYSGFAEVYDFLMKDIDYDVWVDYIEEIFKRRNYVPRNILELACGTGNITNRLAKKGYNITGLDISSEMLTFAKDKAYNLGVDVTYINQDMKELEFSGKVDCVLCLCDGFNYILDKDELFNIFKRIYLILQKNGLFIFDISSYYKISEVLGTNTYAENFEDVSYIWENYFDSRTDICEFDLTIFIRQDSLFKRIQESHCQRAYKIESICQLLEEIGFKSIEVFNSFTFDKPLLTDERINFVCKK